MAGEAVAARYDPDDSNRSAITSRVLNQIRQDIIIGLYAPGERLVEVTLAERYKVSRGSLRTAFTILEKEGIVQSLANGRKIVTGLDVKYTRDLFGVRCMLERQAHAEILESTKPDYESLMKLLQLLGAVEQAGDDYEAYCRIDIEFHRTMIVLSGNRALLQSWEATAPIMLALLHLNADETYRREYIETFIERHHRFVDLIMLHDQGLCDYTKAHITAGCEVSCQRASWSGRQAGGWRGPREPKGPSRIGS